MRLGLILGDQRRHLALMEALAGLEIVTGAVVQSREEVPFDDSHVPSALRSLFRTHFDLRRQAEEFFFPSVDRSEFNTIEVSASALNSEPTVDFLKSLSPDLVLSFGCGLLKNEVIERVGVPFWNVHGGLSPRYRGSATLFWPVYFLEPQWCGMTIHETVKRIDAGPIIHQVSARLIDGDGLQMHSARVVSDLLTEMPALISSLVSSGIPEGSRQTSPGKLFLQSDWRPEHLLPIYEQFSDNVVGLAANGELGLLSTPTVQRLV